MDSANESAIGPIASTDRCCFFGRTGSGKTTFARYLLGRARAAGNRTVVIDGKHDYDDGKIPVLPAYNPRKPHQILRIPVTSDEAQRTAEAFSAIRRGPPCITYVDELTLSNPSTRTLMAALANLIRTGRRPGYAVWCGTQRPKDIPSPVFTESEHIFCFQLQYDDDRAKVARFTSGAMLPLLESLSGHQCVYYNVRTGRGRLINPVLTKEPTRANA